MSAPDNGQPFEEDWTELARRSSAGVDVTLLWAAKTNTIAVAVDDAPADNHFDLIVEPADNPLDVFLHPYAYAAWRGLDYGLVDAREAA
jgi:hypothetical protein